MFGQFFQIISFPCFSSPLPIPPWQGRVITSRRAGRPGGLAESSGKEHSTDCDKGNMDMEGRVFERVFGIMRRNYASTRSGATAIVALQCTSHYVARPRPSLEVGQSCPIRGDTLLCQGEARHSFSPSLYGRSEPHCATRDRKWPFLTKRTVVDIWRPCYKCYLASGSVTVHCGILGSYLQQPLQHHVFRALF